MEIQEMGRTVRPDAEAIKRLRVAKGWSVEVLADKAICSPKTLQNIENGKRVYLSTLSKIAAPPALNVEVMTLVEGGKPPPEPPRPQPLIQMQFVLSIPFDQFDESAQLGGFIDFLKKFMKGGGDVNVLGVTPGSTLITVAVSIEDMLALSSAFKVGKLAEMQVVDCYPLVDTAIIDPGYKAYNPQLDAKSSLTGDTSKDFTQSKIEPQEPKDKTHKPDTKQ
jgi:transcriptional regulator with XRE-family HTH domain